ncbi:retinol dehydrogenase 11-like isoform X2 [Portunus trituberculatus]|uniref:retinol dehydrogenase 11-like isoform X2 n=1 Tax=Portunus trituberculatus TaxID=210409 RepID=UPI001E1D10A5|nr:retinol dehydrogenase 11-like isoform X2 [Portunus trituberculatus]
MSNSMQSFISFSGVISTVLHPGIALHSALFTTTAAMLVPMVVGVMVVVVVVHRCMMRRCISTRSLAGMTAIVTGASADYIISVTGNKNVVVYLLDTSDLSSVRSFAKDVLKTEGSIHILVNNAGIGGKEIQEMTRDGFELTMATNYYGHFLLTNLLLKRLKESAPSRVVNVSSLAHLFVWQLNLKDLNFKKRSYSLLRAYSQSKLCNILFSLELAEKLHGSGVVVNSLHPGTINSEFVRDEMVMSWWRKPFLLFARIMLRLFGKDSELGAQTTIHLAVSEEVEGVTGKYFDECKEATSSWLARDRGLAKALWEITEADVQLAPNEIFY